MRFRSFVHRTLALLAAAALLGLPGFAEVENRGAQSWQQGLNGKYWTDDGGYMVISADEFGKAVGYFVRESVFGEIFGVVKQDRFEGFWAQKSGPVCPEPRHGYASWGRALLEFDGKGGFSGLYASCGGDPRGGPKWTGRR